MSQTWIGGRLFRVFFGIMALLLADAAAMAQKQQVVGFDPVSTTVEFTLGDVLHTVHGTFKLKSGVIRFDPVTGVASGALVIDATSGDSGNKSRDKKMHRDILESDKYPEIVFIPQYVFGSVPAQGRSQVSVQGLFRMHGSEHPLTLIVPITIKGNQLSANTQFLVPYQSWGLKNPSTFILRVSDQVQINIAANGRIALEQASLAK